MGRSALSPGPEGHDLTEAGDGREPTVVALNACGGATSTSTGAAWAFLAAFAVGAIAYFPFRQLP